MTDPHYTTTRGASMAETKQALEIVPVREFEGGPEPLEFYARGHHNRDEFLRAVVEQYDPWSQEMWCRVSMYREHYIRHEFWRAVPTGLEECPFTYFVTKPGRGAFPVTVVDV